MTKNRAIRARYANQSHAYTQIQQQEIRREEIEQQENFEREEAHRGKQEE